MKKEKVIVFIVSVLLFLSVTNSFSYMFLGCGVDGETIASAQGFAKAVKAAIESSSSVDEQIANKKSQDEIIKSNEKLAKWVESNAAFISKSLEVKKTISLTLKLPALLEETYELQNKRKGFGYNSSFDEFEYNINSIRITTKIQDLSTLLTESLNNTSGLDKSEKWNEISTGIFVLFQDLSSYRNQLVFENDSYTKREQTKKENIYLIQKKYNFIHSSSKLK